MNELEIILLYIFGVSCIVFLMRVVGFKVEIRFHTLPSIFAPMPEECVLKLKNDINKLKNR